MRWFLGLPPCFITSCADLATAFESQFVANKTKRLEVIELFDIKQPKMKMLEQYLVWFNTALVQVDDPNQNDSLALSRPASMTEIRARDEKHVEAEEDKEDQCPRVPDRPQTSRAHILKEVYHLKLLNISPPTQRHLGPSLDEWCEFYKDRDHSTKDCRVLKSQIEKLIHDGYLRHFIKKSENERRTTGELPKRDRS
ncbi:hypothetical protein CR513_06187, partial [Mucuna pruriens]